ncbi:hypothetical protein DFH06DRAFT_1327788 [Mycena polygramma]|nr:hypothetical protein DFH06DRAFT_1327788 [Mycena polygramma]
MLVADGAALLLTSLLPSLRTVESDGANGSFFTPETLSAELGDTTTFLFQGGKHTVTRSSFDAPCLRLAGGFDSGAAGGGAVLTLPPSIWTLTITDVTERTHSSSSRPGCVAKVADMTSDMVLLRRINPPVPLPGRGRSGHLNSPSIAMPQQFKAAAKLVTSTPSPSPSFIASGQGAFASNSPMPTLTSTPLSSSSSTTPTSTSTTTSSSAASTAAASGGGGSGNHTTVIAACATAGGIVVAILIFLTIFFRRRRWQGSSEGDGSMYHEDKTVHLATPTTMHTFPTMTPFVMYPNTRSEEDSSAPPSSPSRRDPFGGTPSKIRPLPRAPASDDQAQHRDSSAPSSVPDINALAMEVANVLLQTPPRPGSRQHLDSLRKSYTHTEVPDSQSSPGNDTSRAAPPHYSPSS